MEMLSLMAKQEAEAKEKTAEKNRGRVYLQRQGRKKRSKQRKGGSRGRDRQRTTAKAMEKTTGNIYREHKKNRDRAVKREAETENTEEETKRLSSGGRG